MLSQQEQIARLQELGRKLWRDRWVNSQVHIGLGDVPALVIQGNPGIEVVFVTGTFDIWVDGDLQQADMNEDQVLERLQKSFA